MPDPRVSILLPVFNAAEHLPAAIQSLLRQTLEAIEIIAIDDGSTDESGTILQQYAELDGRIRLYRQKNRGLIPTLNYGLTLCRCQWVARMDADDISLPGRLEKQYSRLQSRTGTVVLGTALEYLGPRGPTGVYSRQPSDAAAIRHLLPRQNCISHPTVMMRKVAVETVGGYRSAYPHAEDYDLWMRLLKIGDLENLPEPLVQYRVHNAQISARHLRAQALSIAAVQLGTEPELLSPAIGDRGVLENAAGYVALLLRIGELDAARTLLSSDEFFKLAAIPRQSAARRRWLTARLQWAARHRISAVTAAVISAVQDPRLAADVFRKLLR